MRGVFEEMFSLATVLPWGIAVMVLSFGVGYAIAGRRARRVHSPPDSAEGLEGVLEEVRTETGSRGVALFDEEGLLLGAVGVGDRERTGAWVGLVGAMMHTGRELGLCGPRPAFVLHDETGVDVCCSPIRVEGQPLILATVGASQSFKSASERVLTRVAQQLLR